MTIPFFGAPGDYFNRIGKLGAVLKNLKAYQTTQKSAFIDTTNGIVAQYNAESDLQALMGSAYIAQLNSPGAVGTLMANLAQLTTNRVVFRDLAQLNQNLISVNLVDSLAEIILQMKQAGATVQACTIGSTINNNPNGTNVGNGVVNVATKRPSDGLVQQNIFAETVTLICTDDSYVGSAAAGNEGFNASGQGNQPNVYAFDWPLGSNASLGLSAIDGNTDVGSGNLLTGSGFNATAWTGNALNNWTLNAGVAGTNIIQNTSQQYDGSACVQIAGDGTSNFNISQTFNLAAGTTGTLSPLTQYSFNCFMKRDGVVPGSGQLTVDLVDGTNTVINDANSIPNSFTIDLTALTTSYAQKLGTFRTPLILPSTIKIRIRLTTSLTNGRSVFLDKASLGIFSRFYQGGPSLAIHAGSTPFNENDFMTVAFTNDRGGAADGVSTFQTLFMRTLPMMANNLLLPFSVTPNVSDGLIQ